MEISAAMTMELRITRMMNGKLHWCLKSQYLLHLLGRGYMFKIDYHYVLVLHSRAFLIIPEVKSRDYWKNEWVEGLLKLCFLSSWHYHLHVIFRNTVCIQLFIKCALCEISMVVLEITHTSFDLSHQLWARVPWRGVDSCKNI